METGKILRAAVTAVAVVIVLVIVGFQHFTRVRLCDIAVAVSQGIRAYNATHFGRGIGQVPSGQEPL